MELVDAAQDVAGRAAGNIEADDVEDLLLARHKFFRAASAVFGHVRKWKEVDQVKLAADLEACNGDHIHVRGLLHEDTTQ